MVSTSENIQVALQFAQASSIDKKHVLIVFFASNMCGNEFKRIGSSNFSVYEHEMEILFANPLIHILKIADVQVNDPVAHAKIFNKF